MSFRRYIAKQVSRKIISGDFTILSDDCWGGEVYKFIGTPAITPTVGLGIAGDDYFNILENIKQPDANTFTPQRFYKLYPVAATPYGKIHFLHYPTRETAERIFRIEYQQINWSRIYYKIDLEKPCFTVSHIQRWNEMQLPHSIALYSDRTRKLWNGPIHNGLYCPKYTIDGSAMFHISCRYFNLFHWIRTGEVTNHLFHRIVNFMLFDPKAFRRLTKKLRQ